jgi:hypothetical protein
MPRRSKPSGATRVLYRVTHTDEQTGGSKAFHVDAHIVPIGVSAIKSGREPEFNLLIVLDKEDGELLMVMVMENIPATEEELQQIEQGAVDWVRRTELKGSRMFNGFESWG